MVEGKVLPSGSYVFSVCDAFLPLERIASSAVRFPGRSQLVFSAFPSLLPPEISLSASLLLFPAVFVRELRHVLVASTVRFRRPAPIVSEGLQVVGVFCDAESLLEIQEA